MGVVTTIQDIMDIAKYGINAAVDASNKNRSKSVGNYSYSSAARAASNLIAVFPVLCSSNAKPETGSLIVKTIERKGCISLQLALTAVNLNNAETGFDYLRNFHQNINTGGSTMDDYEMMLSKYIEDVIKNESTSFKLTTEQTTNLVLSMKEMFTQKYQKEFNHLSLNDYVVEESIDGYDIQVDRYKEMMVQEAQKQGGGSTRTIPELKDSDAKKANESVPSLMIVRFTNKESKSITEFIIGIKAKLIPTNYVEILSKIYSKNKDGRGLLNLIRATSGEINWFTDYLLAIDKSRDDILAMKKRGSREGVWKTLENRAEKSKWLLRQHKTNYASAITTVVITSEDADLLYKEENIDINNVREAKKFMEAYNLFALVIVNEAEESASFMYDEQEPFFEKLSYTMLERESSDGQYKKIVNLISKMR